VWFASNRRRPELDGPEWPRRLACDPILGCFKEEKIGGSCWGFVAGKSNTIFAWETWQKPEPNPEPKIWFHDIFRTDGTPFDPKEVEYIQKLIGAKK
jgi:hypothetical protein